MSKGFQNKKNYVLRYISASSWACAIIYFALKLSSRDSQRGNAGFFTVSQKTCRTLTGFGSSRTFVQQFWDVSHPQVNCRCLGNSEFTGSLITFPQVIVQSLLLTPLLEHCLFPYITLWYFHDIALAAVKLSTCSHQFAEYLLWHSLWNTYLHILRLILRFKSDISLNLKHYYQCWAVSLREPLRFY